MEEIIDKQKRIGILGYLTSGFDAKLKKLTVIREPKKDPASCDLVAVGTPIWAGAVSPAIRTYLSQHKGHLKRVAFFCTCGDSNGSAFSQMEELCGQKPLALFEVRRKEVDMQQHLSKIEKYAEEIGNS